MIHVQSTVCSSAPQEEENIYISNPKLQIVPYNPRFRQALYSVNKKSKCKCTENLVVGLFPILSPPSAAVIVGTIFWNQNLIFIGEQPGDWGEFGSRLKYTKQTQDSRQVTIKLQTNIFIITINHSSYRILSLSSLKLTRHSWIYINILTTSQFPKINVVEQRQLRNQIVALVLWISLYLNI